MTVNRGRIVFYVFIWVYALVYYLECTVLPEFTEKITISVAFWLMTLFVIIEIVHLLKIEKLDGGVSGVQVGLWKNLMSDKRVHLSIMVAVYLVIIPYLGFYVSSLIVYIGTSRLLGTKGIWGNLLPGLLLTTAIYFLFSFLLKLNLPRGFLS